MPVDPNNPAVIFLRALADHPPTDDQLEALDPGWSELVQAALDATPIHRRTALLLATARQTDPNRLLAVLRGEPSTDPLPWPDPIPFGPPDLPPFPYEALPDWLGSFVRAEARATQTPPDLAGLLALAVLSSCVAGPIALNPWGDWIEPLNLFTIVVLPPGHRKSAVFNSVTRPLQQFEADAATALAPTLALARRRQHAVEQALLRAQDATVPRSPLHSPDPAAVHAPIYTSETIAPGPDDDRHAELLATVERRIQELAALEMPVIPRLVTDDCSPERLAMLLAEQGGRLAILSPEGGIFDLIAGRYSSTGAPNLDHYLKGHAGDPILACPDAGGVDRVSRPGEIIPRPALTVGLAVQPEVLRSLLARPGFHGRGLLARFLYAVPTALLGARAVDPEPVPEPLRTQYHRRIRALLYLTHPTPSSPSTFPTSHPDVTPGLPLSRARRGGRGPHGRHDERGAGGEGSPPRRGAVVTGNASFPHPHSSLIPRPSPLRFSPAAAERLRQFAEAVEPRLAPEGDLDPIVDWASKLVGAVARLAGLLHIASLDLPCPLSPVPCHLVQSAITLADYFTEHAKAAYAAMGLDPIVANVPDLLTWVRRTGRATFTRRDARRSMIGRLRSDADLDDALDQLEQHGYIRLVPAPRGPKGGRPSVAFHVHPSFQRR